MVHAAPVVLALLVLVVAADTFHFRSRRTVTLSVPRRPPFQLHAKKRSIVNRTRISKDGSVDEDSSNSSSSSSSGSSSNSEFERDDPVYNPSDVRVEFVKSRLQSSGDGSYDSSIDNVKEINEESINKMKSTILSGKGSLFDELESDLAAFKQKSSSSSSGGPYGNGVATSSIGSSDAPTLLERVRDVVQSVLIADFFVVIIFLVWFLIGAVLKDSNEIVLMR